MYFWIYLSPKTQYIHSLPRVSYDDDVFVYCFSLGQINALFFDPPNFLINCFGSHFVSCI